MTQCSGKYVNRLYRLQFTHLIDRKSSSVQTNASVYTLLIEHMVQFLRVFLLQIFFHESSYPKPLDITKGSFRIFRKFAETFANQGEQSVSTIPAVNLTPVPLLLLIPAANISTNLRKNSKRQWYT